MQLYMKVPGCRTPGTSTVAILLLLLLVLVLLVLLLLLLCLLFFQGTKRTIISVLLISTLVQEIVSGLPSQTNTGEWYTSFVKSKKRRRE